ncbi:aminodeoxychorismate lyase [Vibrio cincinnatiensis]|jgi:4-amino-4-deoxychorismate lyase|uniref:Aminodeoxychorismate lyase n=1 Tax=Vibrio cincinnatiensis DSM 19608 TaxID=1123491 RepID=A0A1T4L7P8_VIBCI|nr:aminodeoxychorismate lyase [Vibrio cincinnatiensis]MCG3722896.1 aminodeoxychorismate lyase [Vibrio cincinnatiensis]MCG3731686.1 aminodeoxychorismate lyase [Vibrio cincinnatiensis]MCG3736924.1 aminodeoxychorismate lyase [Vibrio cincinnatiensis]MCG3738330.1 aminodeoxychorismate lyase [Vibrio cincinnatiensis]MCG3747461.1 aminodeoxychorismate lyase [Vibrio cincinnatiensis]
MYWHNGQVVDSVSIADRSFQYGDGCFTTILTKYGHIQHWHYHRERMEACLEHLGIIPPDWKPIYDALKDIIAQDDKAGVKLHVSRGCGGRGYSPTQHLQANVTLHPFEYPEHYRQWRISGLSLGVCTQKLGINPLLAGHKHNNRLEQILLKGEMDRVGYPDGVCLDLHDCVVETTMANLFWVKGNTLYTPNLQNAGVEGVARRIILQSASTLGLTVNVGNFPLELLYQADEVFISNALLEVAPIINIASQSYTIGTYARFFQEIFDS